MEEHKKELVCYTIGHSVHSTDQFIELLKRYSIQWVADVRSIPYSQRNPQFNRELIKADIEKNGISYVFLGDSLGARYNDCNLCFADKPVVDFRKIRELDSFKKGINRIINDINQSYRITLMCSEKDPFNCHRFTLVSYALAKKGVTVKHILENGEIILNEALEKKLIKKYKLSYRQLTFFENPTTKKNVIERGYVERNRDVGFSQEEPANTKEQL